MNANAGGRSFFSRLPGRAFGARHRTALTRGAISVGVVLLILAIAAPTIIVPSLKELPADVHYDVSMQPARGILIDSAAYRDRRPSTSHASDPTCTGHTMPTRCYIETNVPLRATKKITTASSSKKKAKLRVSSTLYAGTPQGTEAKNEVGSIHDHVTLNRHTMFPSKNAESSVSIDFPGFGTTGDIHLSTRPFVRDGYQFRFPFGSERRSYRFFDTVTGSATPIDFVDAVQQRGKNVYTGGIDVYQYSQDLGPVNLYDSQQRLMDNAGGISEKQHTQLNTLRRTIPASSWGLNSDAPIHMDPYYVATRTINVEPASGIITNNSVKIWVFYAQNYNEAKNIVDNRDNELASPTRTMLYFDSSWDEHSTESRLHTVHDVIKPLNIWSKAVPWITGLTGMVLLLAGLYSSFDSRQPQRKRSLSS